MRVDAEDPRWFEPLHVRDPRAARSRIADQVAAGADVVVAPTWQTHRRALLPVGETRRAREWTARAASVGREAIEEGLERRAAESTADERVADVEAPGPGQGDLPRSERPAPLLAGVLPPLDAEPEPGSGRLATAESAAERDYRDQAGLLGDAEVDVILIEGQGTVAAASTALEAVTATGLPAWIAAIPRLFPRHPEDGSLQRWIDTSVQFGAGALLAPASGSAAGEQIIAMMARGLGETGLRWGCQIQASSLGADADGTVDEWVQAGAELFALLDGATTAAIEGLRAAIDRVERMEDAVAAAERHRWWSFVEDAARMAPGGVALWIIGEQAHDGDDRRPPGFDWVTSTKSDLPQMPLDHFRFIVDAAGSADVRPLGPLLEDGGLLVTQLGGVRPHEPALRLLRVDESGDPAQLLFRREP